MPDASSLTADRVLPRAAPGTAADGMEAASDGVVVEALRLSLHRSVAECEKL